MYSPDPSQIVQAISKRSFCVLATQSAAGYSHGAGVLYAMSGSDLYVSTLTTSRKARNVLSNGSVGVTIPIRRLPVGPPSTVQFQTKAEILDATHPDIVELHHRGEIASITGHGEMNLLEGCFMRIGLPSRVNTYGLGMSLWRLIRDPLAAGGSADLVGSMGGEPVLAS